MKAFISYSMADKNWPADTKKVLDRLGIESFMAHEDLVVSEEWKDRILKELKACDIFICLLSKNFKASDWCPQELGFIAARPKTVIIPLSIDRTVPFGFISHIQGQLVNDSLQIEDRIVNALLRKKLNIGVTVSIKRMLEVRDYRVAEDITRRLIPFFQKLSVEQANEIAAAAVKNSVVWDAGECASEILPKFLDKWDDKILARTAKALRFQITERTRYKE